MKKQIILMSLLTMISASGFASGFYIGGELGLDAVEVKHHNSGPGFSDRHRLGAFGFMGGGFAGYNFDFGCHKFDFAVEGFITGASTETRRDYESGTTFTDRHRVHYNYSYGARLLPGFYIMGDCVEVHGIVGYTRANLSYDHRSLFTTTDHRFCRTFELNGWQVGGGLRLDFCNNISLRFDGVFNGYESHHNRHDVLFTGDTETTHFYHSHQLIDFNGTFALIYNF